MMEKTLTLEFNERELYIIINALTMLHNGIDKLGTAAHRFKAAEIKEFAAKLDGKFVGLYLELHPDLQLKSKYTVTLEKK